MPQIYHYDKQDVVLHDVDDPVVTDSYTQAIAPAKTLRSWRPGILSEQSNRTLNSFAMIRMHLA